MKSVEIEVVGGAGDSSGNPDNSSDSSSQVVIADVDGIKVSSANVDSSSRSEHCYW